MASILDELVEAMTQEKDPKRLTQKQQDRLTKRVKDIAAQHKLLLEKAYEEAQKPFMTTTVSDYNNGYSREEIISPEKISRSVVRERAAGKKYTFNSKALVADLEEYCLQESAVPRNFTVDIRKYMPEARKRIEKQKQELDALKQKKQKVEYQIDFDMNEIIDAAIFYRSEHILNVLETFSTKEYSL